MENEYFLYTETLTSDTTFSKSPFTDRANYETVFFHRK